MQKNVIEYLKKTTLSLPNKIAVKDNVEEISFKQLYDSSLNIASKIYGCNVRNSPVAVFLNKSGKAIEAFAGINMSGNFYVPIDIKSPDSRIISIIEVLDAKVIITNNENKSRLSNIYNGKILVIDDIEKVKNPKDIEDIFNTSIDTDPAYAIFTSGSTGTPKGVVIPHRGIIDYIDWAIHEFNIDSETMIGNQAPFYFDNSTLDIYLMYSTGATLNIIPESNFIFPAKLVDYLNEHKITFIFWVPFALINIANLNIFHSNVPLFLKDVFFAGEVMPNKHLNYWRRYLPNCRYVNLYGPTEITVDCSYYIVKREFGDNESLPIGFPCRNTDILILTETNELAKMNQQGELCVRGSSLSLGYYNDPEKTAKAFVQNPLHSHYPEIIYRTGDIVYRNELEEIIYIGRKDFQIKHNGYRIELGEIETAALGTKLINNCCAVYNNTLKQIVLFYLADTEINLSTFRKLILVNIPKYMVPSIYNKVDILKQNTNGKIDRLFYNEQVNK